MFSQYKPLFNIICIFCLSVLLSCSKNKPNEPPPIVIDTTPKFIYVCDIGDNKEIFSMNPDGSEQINLTNHDSIDIFPDWSPDGQKIVFTSNRTGTMQIFLMDYDGDNLTQLTFENNDSFYPKWSPDGNQIAFLTSCQMECDNIFTINHDGTDLKQITFDDKRKSAPDWSPDSKQLTYKYAYITNLPNIIGIAVIDADGNHYMSLYEESIDAYILLSNHFSKFSPDGLELLFSSIYNHICVVSVDGNNVRQLTSDGSNYEPSWSPDGNLISFYSTRSSGAFDIWVMRKDGEGQYNLTNSSSSDFHPVWSHGGTMITFLSDRGNSQYLFDLYAVSVDPLSTFTTRLTNNDYSEFTPCWRPVPKD